MRSAEPTNYDDTEKQGIIKAVIDAVLCDRDHSLLHTALTPCLQRATKQSQCNCGLFERAKSILKLLLSS